MPLEPLIETRSRIANLVSSVRAGAVSAAGLGSLIGLNILQVLSLLVRPVSPRAFRSFNRSLAHIWWGLCVSVSQRLNGTTIRVSGVDLPLRENAIVIANHQQMPDITTIMALAKTKHRLGDLKFFVKDAIKWMPGVGWGMKFIDCVFVKRNWADDSARITKTFSRLVDNKVPVWLVSFVEGTRARLPKIKASQEFAVSRGLHPLNHVILPRTKGFIAMVEGLRDHVPAIYDLTIGYEIGVPSLWQFIKGSVRRIHLHARRFPIDDLPHLEAEVAGWLHDRWLEKDRLLEHFYVVGSFPDEPLPAEFEA